MLSFSGATGTIQVTLDYGQTYVVAAEQNTLNSREGIIELSSNLISQ